MNEVYQLTLDTAVAGSGGLLGFLLLSNFRHGLLLLGKGAWHFLLCLRLSWGQALSVAVDNASVLDESLDHPVARAGAVNARFDA